MLILRHAWLNLWDKHMTTGRINQVSVDNRPHSESTKESLESSIAGLFLTLLAHHSEKLARNRGLSRSPTALVLFSNNVLIPISRCKALCHTHYTEMYIRIKWSFFHLVLWGHVLYICMSLPSLFSFFLDWRSRNYHPDQRLLFYVKKVGTGGISELQVFGASWMQWSKHYS